MEKLWRCWLEIENPRLPVPAYALPQAIKLEGDRLTCQFQQCAPIAALLQGVRFKDSGAIARDFEATLGGTSGYLKPLGSGYSIDENDLKECSFLAYYLPDGESRQAQTIAIVGSDELNGSDRLCLSAGGKFQATPNLVGKTIKLRCTYPSSVAATQERIETVLVHLVGKAGGTVRYSAFEGCKIDDVRGKLISFKLGQQHQTFNL